MRQHLLISSCESVGKGCFFTASASTGLSELFKQDQDEEDGFCKKLKIKMARIANKMTMKMVSFANKMTMKMVSFANKQHIKNSHAVQWLLIANTHSTSVYIVLSVVFIFSIFWTKVTIILLLTGQQYYQSYLFSNSMFANIILLFPF